MRRSAPGQRWLRRTRGILGVASLVAAASIVGVLGGSGTFALWSGGTTLLGSSIGSSESALVVSPASLTATNLLPREVARFSFELTDDGDSRLDVEPTIGTTPGMADFELRVLITALGTNCTDPSAPAFLDISGYDPVATTFDPDANVLDAVIAPHETLQACATITALPTVVPEESIAYELNLDGTQIG